MAERVLQAVCVLDEHADRGTGAAVGERVVEEIPERRGEERATPT
jgi:hypothetical protein